MDKDIKMQFDLKVMLSVVTRYTINSSLKSGLC